MSIAGRANDNSRKTSVYIRAVSDQHIKHEIDNSKSVRINQHLASSPAYIQKHTIMQSYISPIMGLFGNLDMSHSKEGGMIDGER